MKKNTLSILILAILAMTFSSCFWHHHDGGGHHHHEHHYHMDNDHRG